MPARDWQIRIDDTLDAIESIRLYVADMDVAAFCADQRTIGAVVRNPTIIGEAAMHVPDIVVQAHPEIPWIEMRAVRNIVVHEYFGVSNRILWDTVRLDLPPLVGPLQNLVDNDAGWTE